MKRLLDLLFSGLNFFCKTILGVLTITVLITVFGRYLLNSTPRWGEETALMLVVWLSLLATPLGIRNGWHIKLDLLTRSLPEKGRSGLFGLNWIISFILSGMFVFYGIHIALQNLNNLMPGLGIPAFWQYLSIPVSGVLMVIALLEIALIRPIDAPDRGVIRS